MLVLHADNYITKEQYKELITIAKEILDTEYEHPLYLNSEQDDFKQRQNKEFTFAMHKGALDFIKYVYCQLEKYTDYNTTFDVICKLRDCIFQYEDLFNFFEYFKEKFQVICDCKKECIKDEVESA